MKINQLNGAVTTLSSQNTPATERADETRTASSSRAPESSVTWKSTVSQTVADNSQDIDTARVNEIKEAIQNGDFKIDVEKIADGLIEETRQYLDQD